MYVERHLMEGRFIDLLFAVITMLASGLCGYLISKIKIERGKNNAIAEGVQCLLRESIVSNYNKYQDREFCPIYAKESVKKAYHAYHELGGNDVATTLYNKILDMPEEREEKDNV